MATLDSYSESNKNKANSVEQSGSGDYLLQGQCFKTPDDGVSYTLDSSKFYLANHGSMTGTIRAVIKAHSGTYGSTGKPTGSVLATSDSVNLNTLTSDPTFGLVTFSFTGANRITLTPNTPYCMYVECPTGNGDNATKWIQVGGANPGGHSGNLFYLDLDNTTLVAVSTQDFCFYVYGVTGDTGSAPIVVPTLTLLNVG